MKRRIMVLFNPISGAGRALAAARAVAECVRAKGHEVVTAQTQLGPAAQWLDSMLSGIDLLVIAGGDGAVRLAAESATRIGTPIYHLPFGTENLFAREFGMNRDPKKLCAAIDQFRVERFDTGDANGRIFLLMASVGFDAEVVHDLASRRGASISHFSYVAPIAVQLWRWKPSRLEVRVDGERIDDGGPGFVVVANSKQYGWRLNPAARASMNDGLLDVAYFPAASRRALIGWAIQCRLQSHLRHPRMVYRVGRTILVQSTRPERYQLDGDPPGAGREFGGDGGDAQVSSQFRLEIGLKPHPLAVLLPLDRCDRA